MRSHSRTKVELKQKEGKTKRTSKQKTVRRKAKENNNLEKV